MLFYCVDEGKASTKNRKTGKVVGTPDGTESLLQYRTRLEKISEGVWKTTVGWRPSGERAGRCGGGHVGALPAAVASLRYDVRHRGLRLWRGR